MVYLIMLISKAEAELRRSEGCSVYFNYDCNRILIIEYVHNASTCKNCLNGTSASQEEIDFRSEYIDKALAKDTFLSRLKWVCIFMLLVILLVVII